MRVKKIYFIIVVSIIAILGTYSFSFSEENPKALFQEANIYYEGGDYGKAIEVYEKILKEGHESGPLYYNLGDAYFKSDKLGMAILNYERAKKLMPRDPDLNANYRFAASRIKDNRRIPSSSIWNWTPLKTYEGSFTADELLLFAVAAYLIMVIILAGFVIRPDMKNGIIIATSVMAVIAVINVVVLHHKVGTARAVTVASEADALFGPFDSGTKFFTLQEGMVCSILQSKDDWCKIRREDGKTGWVKKSAVEKI